MPAAKTKYLTSQHIKDGFRILDIYITPKQLEFLLIRLYDFSNDFKKMDHIKMFEMFENEEHKRIKKIMEQLQQDESEQ